MNKKDMIRKYIIAMKDNAVFTADNLADWVNKANSRKDITPKDISNTILPLVKSGCINKIENTVSKPFVYTVVANNVALWFAKHPILGRNREPSIPGPKQKEMQDKHTPSRRKNRSAFIMALDTEIQKHESMIKELKTMRGRHV